jgi:NADPH-dependent ferric siderophore reductase
LRVTRPLDPTSIELASRLGITAKVAVVAAAEQISPTLRAITLHGVSELAGVAGNDVMLEVSHNGRPVRRRYSVRSVNTELDEIVLWIATGHQGPGAALAREVQIGDELDVVGPRGKIPLDPMADWHLFIGDASSLAAFYRMAESIEEPGRAVFIVETPHPDDAVTPNLPEGIGATGIFLNQDASLSDTSALLHGLAAFAFPPDEGHAYLFGEFKAMKTMRTALLDRGLSNEQISVKAFWRTGSANADHGEPDKS